MKSFFPKNISILLFTAISIFNFFIFTGDALAANPALEVTNITGIKTFAIADGTFSNGWSWVFDVTIPSDEVLLKMRFSDWINGLNTIPATNNIAFYSAQSLNAPTENEAIVISGADSYSGEMLVNFATDLDPQLAGRQIQITVEASIPNGSIGGSYSTTYGIQSNPDSSFPVISGTPGNMTVEATSSSGAVVSFSTPTATDTVDGSIPVTCLPASESTFGLGVNTVTCTATDSSNNESTSTFTVTVRDTTNPTITVPENQSFQATGFNTEPVIISATATDAVDPNPTIAYAPHSFQLGDTTVTWTATDFSGNSSTATSTVTIHDTTSPVISGTPGNMTVEATSSSGAVVSFSTPTATDTVDGSIPVTCLPASESTFGLGVNTVKCTAKNSSGRKTTSTFTVTVRDTTNPTITAPADQYFEATGSLTNPLMISATATDAVDPNPTIAYAPHSFPIGTTIVTWTATDLSGNTSTATSTATIQDTTSPVISGTPGNMTVEATSSSGAVVSFSAPTATDIVDGTVPVTCLPASGSTFGFGVSTVTCTTTDNAGNTATSTFTITVQDTIPPAISSISSITVEATSSSGAVVSFSAPTATDIVDGTVPVTCPALSGSLFAIGINTVTCTATDNAGNTATSTFTVTVQDTILPVITLNGISEINLKPNDSYNDAGATAMDNIDGDITSSIVVSGTFVDTSVSGVFTIAYDATDSAGNQAVQVIRTINIDNISPTITAPADQYFEATGPLTTPVLIEATATDNIDPIPTITYLPDSFPIGTTTVTWTATDLSGNTSTATSTVTIQDTTSPVISNVPADITVEATSSSGAAVSFSAPTATDIVDGPVPVTCLPASGSTFGLGTNIVDCATIDNAGNENTSIFVITVEDTTPPVITLNGAPTENLVVGDFYNDPGATAMDNVDGDMTSFIVVGGTFVDTSVSGVFTIAYDVIDSAGNQAVQVVRTINISPLITYGSMNPVTSPVQVAYNTTGDDAIAALDQYATVISADGMNSIQSEIYWAIIDYNETIPGDYQAVGITMLPTDWSSLVIDNIVAVVSVLPQ